MLAKTIRALACRRTMEGAVDERKDRSGKTGGGRGVAHFLSVSASAAPNPPDSAGSRGDRPWSVRPTMPYPVPCFVCTAHARGAFIFALCALRCEFPSGTCVPSPQVRVRCITDRGNRR